VLLIDLDDFKVVNDTLGHTVGDRLLAAVGERVRRCVRPGDTVARLGGDEFAVLLLEAGPEVVDGIAERVLASVARPVVVDGYELLVRASIGVAVVAPGDDAEALLRNADIAMYAAKECGKGGSARYVPGMAARILEHAQIGAQLRQALDDGQLHLEYQPVVGLADRRIIGMEALVRWQHPSRGPVAPADFIPTAERTGLIVPLGRWVLREACRQKAAWRKAHGELSPATVGVNVSGRQLQEPGFADEVADAVREFGLEPHNLVLEVTETAVLTGGQVLDTLQVLHDFGVSLALDDFGTGQSSLGLIRTCPVHILKLDKSFVIDGGNGGRSEHQAAVATAVAQIANALGLDAVAEGIETQEQADRVVDLGYRLGQGFHLARPLPPEEIDLLLAADAVRH
jgi:diguanylate cyclase (GGDEF)-like protein